MEKKLEEALEKGLDKLLKETLEKRYFRLMSETFLDLVESKRDFLLGIVVGDLLEGLGFCIWGAHKRHPKDREIAGLFNLIQRRSIDIDSRIESILTEVRSPVSGSC